MIEITRKPSVTHAKPYFLRTDFCWGGLLFAAALAISRLQGIVCDVNEQKAKTMQRT